MSRDQSGSRPAGSDDGGRRGAQIVEALHGAGDVGRDLLAVDWEATPLGPPESWPHSLTTIVAMLLSSRFSMWMAWGPSLTFFCNEAYRRDTLGKKYPWALGRPASEVWAEIWEDIGPRIETVLRTGTATWDESLLLFLERSGYVEETYHTFSYSPLTGDDGTIAGMLCVVSEDTERVIGQRRMATLRDLGSESATGRDEREYLRSASQHLKNNDRSLPFTLMYLLDSEKHSAELVCCTGIETGHPAAPERIVADADQVWPTADLVPGTPVIVEGIDRRFERLPTGAWKEPPTAAVILPLPQPVQDAHPFGFLVVGANRYRPVDDNYLSFLSLLAAQLASGIASARAYEAERRRAEELAELDRAKTAFFTNVSHELRTPLTLLLGPAEDALADHEQEMPASQRHRMEIIARNGARLLKLVNTLLDFSRLESSHADPAFEPVELAQYTAELASMFESAVERAGLQFVIDCPPLPEPVYVDREMWAKIVLNLLSNALKFTLSGSVTVRVQQHDGAALLAVADTGIGIDPDDQSKLFERFHRVAGARGRTHEGSGIGLALVAELARLHGGRADVESVPGAGSTFTVEVPFGHAHLPSERLTHRREVSIEREVAGFLAEVSRWLRADGAAGNGQPESPRAPRDERPRILVVDDNEDMRDYIAALLAEDYMIQTAADGVIALELARADPPDLILTDVMMPRLDGFGLLAALQDDPATLHVPVVMISARAGAEGVIEGLEAGADDYLIKPFSARELRARVHANLELDRARRTREQLERSRTMQNRAERLAEVGSWEVDIQTGQMTGSEHLLQMLGLRGDQVNTLRLEQAIEQIVPSADRDAIRKTIDAAIDSGEPFEYERRPIPTVPDGRWIRVRGEVVCDERGSPTRLTGFVQDITQQKNAERAVAAAAAAREAAAREHRIADELQRSLLPADGFSSDHLEVATFYQSGVADTRVGGDWYDVIDLGAGRTALMIGDVTGRGIPAARIMGQLRAAARAYARLDLPPAEILEMLDSMVRELSNGQLVTCIYGVYDPATRELRYANAGHLPPLLARPGQATERLPLATCPPLGVGAIAPDEHRLTLDTGAVIALYTDGLVERRDRRVDSGIDILADSLRADAQQTAELPNQLVRELVPDGADDDVAILIARIGDHTAHRTEVLDIPHDPSGVHAARRFAAATLEQWSIPETLIRDATLIASELVTNAIVHGQPPIRLRIRRTRHELTVEVHDGASAMPRKLKATAEDVHGRGLAIIAGLSSRWAARPDGHGKVVWSALSIPATR